MTLPLAGIKILDLSRLAPGPYCTMLLGDLGADVLKIEEPFGLAGRRVEQSQGTRDTGFVGSTTVSERSVAFDALERNKKSMTLNLKTEEARRIFYRLTEKADVVVEGFRPGVVKRLAVDYETLSSINPGIIYCSISGYGQDGPYRDMVGHDVNYISVAGALGLIGWPGSRPSIPHNILADFAGGGMHAALAIMVALWAREKTGQGQYLDIAMTDGVLHLMASLASSYFATGHVPGKGNTRLSGAVPYYNIYETKDAKYISIGALEPWFYANLCRILGREDLIPYQNAYGQKAAEIRSIFQEVFRTKTRDEWFALLRQTDVCVGPVYNFDEVFSDPQIIHRQMVIELEHPVVGTVKQVGISVKLSKTPGQVRDFAPYLGEHTEEVLLSLGYDPENIGNMRDKGVI
ncbi:MAG: CoA transferase [Chloroflexi bacterium]|nr:CoA transferase [Chloroflexota bacterium]